MELHYDVHEGTGPYMLLVHGFLSGRSQWQPNLAALSRVVRPVVVELWGHGRSPSPEEPERYYPDGYVTLFEDLRQHLGAERWVLCGQSLGAALTMRYVLTQPSRVLAQVFTNSSATFADAAWLQARRSSALQQAETIERDGHPALEALRVHPVHARRLPQEAQAALVADARLHTPRGIANTLRYTTPNAPVRERVHTLQTPTLLVCGEREQRFHDYRTFAERTIPGLEVTGTPAGHAVNIEAAEAFNTAVVDFIGRYT
jgi:pimeloyl-ACP methyl ester carboxylesterase